MSSEVTSDVVIFHLDSFDACTRGTHIATPAESHVKVSLHQVSYCCSAAGLVNNLSFVLLEIWTTGVSWGSFQSQKVQVPESMLQPSPKSAQGQTHGSFFVRAMLQVVSKDWLVS